MSLMDTLKGLVGKGREVAAENADKIHGAVDKAGEFIDEKTGGKYSDQIGKGATALKNAIPEQPGAESEAAAEAPSAPEASSAPETPAAPEAPAAPEEPSAPEAQAEPEPAAEPEAVVAEPTPETASESDAEPEPGQG
ncbi:antitoxin [Nocardia sp. CA2R105]|uniref:antitoxin n=1 Tax=Nocardia coffeae TaxID=2873381 RepID=UPI001CA649D8|nr:antitoxin [Nocardia coffeae]